jgi:hypothetical protein
VPKDFLTELAQREIKLRQQREVLREIARAWKTASAAACVHKIRTFDTERFDDLERAAVTQTSGLAAPR